MPPTREPLRIEHAEATRERILDTCVALIEAGEEPTMRGVAKAAGIGERTIYRYFASREEIHAGLHPRMRQLAGAPLCDSVDGLLDYATALYTTFDANRALISALTSAAWAAPIFRKTRTSNLADLRALIDAGYPNAPVAERAAAAATLRVPLSGAGWVYLTDCGLERDAAIAHVHWLIRTVLAQLDRVSKPRVSKPRVSKPRRKA